MLRRLRSLLAGRNGMDRRMRRLLAGTTALTGALMLLGVVTASAGAGLTCAGRWPFCDGWLGLFPANWMSFIEWFHRLVAMVTGFVMLGVTAMAWQRGLDRRIRWGLVAAIALLPLQIGLGALTVTLNGLFPGGYSPPVQAAHYLTATVIFTIFVAVTAMAYAQTGRSRLRKAALAGVALLPLSHVFSYGTVFSYDPTVQAIYYGLSLVLFSLLVAVVVWTGGTDHGRQRALSAAAAVLLVFQMLLGRNLLGEPDPLLADGVAIALFACLVGAAVFAYRTDGRSLPLLGEFAGR